MPYWVDIESSFRIAALNDSVWMALLFHGEHGFQERDEKVSWSCGVAKEEEVLSCVGFRIRMDDFGIGFESNPDGSALV